MAALVDVLYDGDSKMTPSGPILTASLNESNGSLGGDSSPFAAFEILPMPIVVLSDQKKVIAASRAFRKLLSLPPKNLGSESASNGPDVTGLPFNQLGIDLLPNKGSNDKSLTLEQVLDGLADEFARTLEVPEHATAPISNVGAKAVPNEPVEDEDDSEFDPWPEDDWSRGPDITLLAKVQRRIPGSKPFKARIIARVWKVEGDTVFLLTIGRPVPQLKRTDKSEDISQSSKQTRRLLKRATLAKMQRALFKSLHWPCYFFSADETMYYPNEAGQKLTGQLEEDYMFEQGRSILERMELWDENFQRKLTVDEYPGIRVVRSRKRIDEERVGFVEPKTGARLRLDVGGQCLYDEHTEEFLGAVLWCRDVTEYTEVIARQRNEIDRGFESKLDNMPSLMFTANPWPNCESDYFSKQWYDYTGQPRDFDPRLAWRDAVHPSDRLALWDTWRQCVQEGVEFEMEARYKRRDGAYRWHLVRSIPQREADGTIVKWHGTFTDMDDLVLKRTEARRRKQQMLTVLAHAEVNLFAVNQNMETTMLEGKIQWGPDAGSNRVTGESALGQHIGSVIEQTTTNGNANASEMVSNIRSILDGTMAMSIFEQNIEDRWYKTRIIPDMDYPESGEPTIVGVLGLSIDITDVKARIGLELERTQLLASEGAAQEANRLKSQFLANVSHELRTPIAGVLGMADLLIETVLDPEQKEYARAIQQSADSLLTIVNDILDFSKIESGRFDIEEVQFDLPNVLGDLVKLMAYAAQRKGLILDYQSSLMRNERVVGDPGRVRQILMNLLTNAIKFTNKGIIKLIVRSKETNAGLECTFIVEDSGIGIRPAVLKKLFRPFSQGDSSTQRLFGGTGLGLTICKELATLMNGRIGLESTPGVGTKATFTVPFGQSMTRINSIDEGVASLPAEIQQVRLPSPVTRQELDARPLRRPSPAFDERSPAGSIDLALSLRKLFQVLVVEDNAINQSIAIKLVKKIGFPVRAVWNGKECLDYLSTPNEQKPRPSLILMDCQMPIMDGYEATRAIRNNPTFKAKFKDVPIIALTASAIVGDREKCKTAGMDDYVTKPVSKQELERALLKWVQKQNGDKENSQSNFEEHGVQ